MTRKSRHTSTTQKNLNTPSRIPDSTDKQTPKRTRALLCIIPGCTGTKLQGRKYCAAHQERANGQTLAEKVAEQRAADDHFNHSCPTCGQSCHCAICESQPNAILEALKRATPWLGKMIADGAHLNSVLPNDCVRTLEMAEAAIRSSAPAIQSEQQYKDTLAAQNDRQRRNNEEEQRQALDRIRCAECTEQTKAAAVQESKTWTLPPVICGECDATADTVLELSRHWKTSGHRTARVKMNSTPRRRKEDQPGTAKTYMTRADECVRLCEAIAAFWGDGVCDAAVYPGAYLTEQDVPIRDLVRAAVGWRKP